MKLLLDCRQGWSVKNFRVPGWRPQIVYTQLPGKPLNEKQVKTVAEQFDPNQLAIIDIEVWKFPEEIDLAIQLVDWWREINPAQRIGYYGIIPGGNYWATVHKGDYKRDWQQYNASLGRTRNALGQWKSRGLIDVVDFVCPSLYSPYAGGTIWHHDEKWFTHYAPEVIEESRKYQKQVYPFVWQRIHPGTTEAGTVPDEQFRRQIQFCIDHADGVCIWDWADANTGTGLLERTNKILETFASEIKHG